MYNATRKLVLRGVDGVVFVADSLRVQKNKNIESLENLFQNLSDEGLSIGQMPIVLQYNKRDLMESNIPLLPVEELENDLNEGLNVPFFEASAALGNRCIRDFARDKQTDDKKRDPESRAAKKLPAEGGGTVSGKVPGICLRRRPGFALATAQLAMRPLYIFKTIWFKGKAHG